MHIVMLTLALLAVLASPALAVQRAQTTCTPPAAGSGDPPTEYRVERETSGPPTGAWDASKAAQVAVLPVSGPLVFVDRAAVDGVPYRFRCVAANATGAGLASAPSQSVTLVPTARVPGQAGITVIIIQEADPVGGRAAPAAPAPKKK